jgi:hypothetical protein
MRVLGMFWAKRINVGIEPQSQVMIVAINKLS